MSRRWIEPTLILISGLCLGGEVRGQAPATGQAERAAGILKKYCYRCHGQGGRNEGGLNFVTDLKKLVESKRVIPREPDRSKLLQRMKGGDMPPEADFEDQSENPPPLPRPTAAEVALLRDWVKAGAPAVATKQAAAPRFLSDLDVSALIIEDLKKLTSRERKFIRYFTLTHLANAGYNADQLQTYRAGLSKLINSLSWSRRIKSPTPVDPAKTVLRIDLRDYLWDEGTWRAILDLYPYGLQLEGTTNASISAMTVCELPYVRADWFVFAASRPPLYHDVLRLPATIEELERKLDVDVAANIRQDRVSRAGFNASGVSRNNRLIERHESTNGAYWRSYDFAGNADRKNLFSHPLGPGEEEQDFEYDGGEIVFALPNGLNGYMLIDAQGKRIDKGPTEIVRDNKQADGAVVNGISCMSCHNRGLIEKPDQVRDVVARTKSFNAEVSETVMVLYPPRDKMDELFKGDQERFAQAVKQSGSALSQTEPVFALATHFEDELNLPLAAAEAGLRVKDFEAMLERSPRLGQSLGPLLVGGTVKRDVFVEAFPLIAEARHVKTIDVAGLSDAATPAPRAGGNRAPAAEAKTKPILGQRKAYPPERLSNFPEEFFGGNRDLFREVGPAGSVLVGVRVSYIMRFGGPKISSIQPIFRVGRTLLEGERHGGLLGKETTAIAKPGYAVGALRTHTGLTVDGFEMVFMKIKGDRLDPNDTYNSPWLGDTRGGSPGEVNSQGNLVVGLQGRSKDEVNALGLIGVK
ncbi:c-type cytochrome domain-containing protein [Singulisphaera sp. PoT]|uniref:c-type cytochrome domain-containing protein n=1 Tax=Singulisphaera sp. PoT TaxID=3411797 RepID=UPI003BF5B730